MRHGWRKKSWLSRPCRWWQRQQCSTSTTGPRKEIRVQQLVQIYISNSWKKQELSLVPKIYNQWKIPTRASHDMWRRPDWLRARAKHSSSTVQYSEYRTLKLGNPLQQHNTKRKKTLLQNRTQQFTHQPCSSQSVFGSVVGQRSPSLQNGANHTRTHCLLKNNRGFCTSQPCLKIPLNKMELALANHTKSHCPWNFGEKTTSAL